MSYEYATYASCPVTAGDLLMDNKVSLQEM
jgi:hypothetical protein